MSNLATGATMPTSSPVALPLDIYRLQIIDMNVSLCLVDHIIKWKTKSAADEVSRLVKALYQLAREIDDGRVNRVLFDVAGDVARKLELVTIRRGRYIGVVMHTISLDSPVPSRHGRSVEYPKTVRGFTLAHSNRLIHWAEEIASGGDSSLPADACVEPRKRLSAGVTQPTSSPSTSHFGTIVSAQDLLQATMAMFLIRHARVHDALTHQQLQAVAMSATETHAMRRSYRDTSACFEALLAGESVASVFRQASGQEEIPDTYVQQARARRKEVHRTQRERRHNQSRRTRTQADYHTVRTHRHDQPQVPFSADGKRGHRASTADVDSHGHSGGDSGAAARSHARTLSSSGIISGGDGSGGSDRPAAQTTHTPVRDKDGIGPEVKAGGGAAEPVDSSASPSHQQQQQQRQKQQQQKQRYVAPPALPRPGLGTSDSDSDSDVGFANLALQAGRTRRGQGTTVDTKERAAKGKGGGEDGEDGFDSSDSSQRSCLGWAAPLSSSDTGSKQRRSRERTDSQSDTWSMTIPARPHASDQRTRSALDALRERGQHFRSTSMSGSSKGRVVAAAGAKDRPNLQSVRESSAPPAGVRHAASPAGNGEETSNTSTRLATPDAAGTPVGAPAVEVTTSTTPQHHGAGQAGSTSGMSSPTTDKPSAPFSTTQGPAPRLVLRPQLAATMLGASNVSFRTSLNSAFGCDSSDDPMSDPDDQQNLPPPITGKVGATAASLTAGPDGALVLNSGVRSTSPFDSPSSNSDCSFFAAEDSRSGGDASPPLARAGAALQLAMASLSSSGEGTRSDASKSSHSGRRETSRTLHHPASSSLTGASRPSVPAN